MLNIIICGVLFTIIVVLAGFSYKFRKHGKSNLGNDGNVERTNSSISELSHGLSYAGIIVFLILGLFLAYSLLEGSPWQGHLLEWLNIIFRLMHITFGIAWIGASFYFVFLENALNRTNNVREELAGNLWAVHGGGFYYLEKYKVAPGKIPENLHWFKYEAYFTWLSGLSLLFVVYYFNASAFLIDKNVLSISPFLAISIGLSSFVVAWILYQFLCKLSIVKKGPLFSLIGFLIAVGFAYFYNQVFSSRAAYIHFGAMLGTLMVANVFFIIIPSQKAMVRAAKEGKLLDAELGKSASLRSLHNNYLTLPVLFVMVSNHFPSTFGSPYPWIILAIISLGTAGVKHWLNLREKGQLNLWVLPASVLVLLAATYMSAPVKQATNCNTTITLAQVNAIIRNRCSSCHSSTPTDEMFTSAPNGIAYNTPGDIIKFKDRIYERAVVQKTMPLNNKTNMTQEERDLIGCWIQQGASDK